eukprot:791147_1
MNPCLLVSHNFLYTMEFHHKRPTINLYDLDQNTNSLSEKGEHTTNYASTDALLNLITFSTRQNHETSQKHKAILSRRVTFVTPGQPSFSLQMHTTLDQFPKKSANLSKSQTKPAIKRFKRKRGRGYRFKTISDKRKWTREIQAKWRAKQTVEQREATKGRIREQKRLRRAAETPEERKCRLDRNRHYRKRYIESSEQREQKLARFREYHRIRKASQTQEEHDAELKRRRERARLKRGRVLLGKHEVICQGECEPKSRIKHEQSSRQSYSAQRRQNNSRVLKCEFCSHQSRSEHSLLRHTYLHTGEKPYSCGKCFRRYTKKCKLQ